MANSERSQTSPNASYQFTPELKAARTAALAAGEILRRHYSERGFTVDQKGKDNPVTTADYEADHRLKEILHGGFPDYGWLSEETADDGARLRYERVWIVDPLDGTKEFIKGIPEFVVAIALAERGVPVVGVTYNPIRDEMFYCARGGGMYLDNAPARVTQRSTLINARVLASRSETSRGEWKAYENVIKVDAIGSVAYKLALVAAGQADATFTLTPKSEWDIASGTALVSEAGGRVTGLDGKEIRFNQASVILDGFVASNGLLHDPIERMLPPD